MSADRKPYVRKTTFFGKPCWVAWRPGVAYIRYDGWHFATWEDAMDHAMGCDL